MSDTMIRTGFFPVVAADNVTVEQAYAVTVLSAGDVSLTQAGASVVAAAGSASIRRRSGNWWRARARPAPGGWAVTVTGWVGGRWGCR